MVSSNDSLAHRGSKLRFLHVVHGGLKETALLWNFGETQVLFLSISACTFFKEQGDEDNDEEEKPDCY